MRLRGRGERYLRAAGVLLVALTLTAAFAPGALAQNGGSGTEAEPSDPVPLPDDGPADSNTAPTPAPDSDLPSTGSPLVVLAGILVAMIALSLGLRFAARRLREDGA